MPLEQGHAAGAPALEEDNQSAHAQGDARAQERAHAGESLFAVWPRGLWGGPPEDKRHEVADEHTEEGGEEDLPLQIEPESV